MIQSDDEHDIAMFFASSVHDMKNSLGLMALMLEKAVRAGERDSGNLLYEVRRINSNLMHLLALYKLGNKLYPFDPTDVAISHLFHDLQLQSDILLKSRNVQLEVEVDEDLTWHFDFDLVFGVLGSAVNNAFKYTENTIRLTATATDDEIELRVEDNGCGFPSSMLVDGRGGLNGIDFAKGSTGLGLYFADRVAGLHRNQQRRGSIRLENGGTLGGGCFILTLP
ncbi:MAG: HAMP domain-containing histidine kinase [Burkholderiales bacterium]|nr:HAMP domain-containing histidine kinase [Burkholderiales bacterium]